MTRFLSSDNNPDGMKLEDILSAIRKDILNRCLKITDDQRPEALHVLNNNMKILTLLTEAIDLAHDSTTTLDKAFGKSTAESGGAPRIGVA